MSCKDPQHQLIFHEYDNLTAHVALYGNLSWQKSQFFFAVESIAFAGVSVGFKDTFLRGTIPQTPALLLLIVVCLFNLWLCYVWFSTNRRNREYLEPLLHRAREIEHTLNHDDATYSVQWSVLEAKPKRRVRTSVLERHIPTGFAIAWTIILLAGSWHGQHFGWGIAIFATLAAGLHALEQDVASLTN